MLSLQIFFSQEFHGKVHFCCSRVSLNIRIFAIFKTDFVLLIPKSAFGLHVPQTGFKQHFFPPESSSNFSTARQSLWAVSLSLNMRVSDRKAFEWMFFYRSSTEEFFRSLQKSIFMLSRWQVYNLAGVEIIWVHTFQNNIYFSVRQLTMLFLPSFFLWNCSA